MASKKSNVNRKAIVSAQEAQSEGNSNKNSLVSKVADGINKMYSGSAFKLDDDIDSMEVPYWIRLNIPALDYAIGGKAHPGVPAGRLIEVFGPESQGKTTIALHIMKRTIDYGGIGIYQDAEFALTDERVEQFDIDLSEVIYSQPETMEQVFESQELVIDMISKENDEGRPVALIWDSVASTPTQSEVDGDYGDSIMGVHARLMSQALRKIRSKIAKQNIIAIYINQIRDKMGVTYGEKTSTFGGRALKFYASVRLEIHSIEKIKKGDDVVGIRVEVQIKKNKVAPPFKKARFDILFEGNAGIDCVGAVLDWCKEKEFIGGSTGW